MLQPTLSYRFVVRFGGDFAILTESVAAIEADFGEKVVEVTIRDTPDNQVSLAIDAFLATPTTLEWELLDETMQTPFRVYSFSSLGLVSHTLKQSYSVAEMVCHVVLLSYEEVDTDYA